MFQSVQVRSLLQQAREHSVFLFQFLPSQPFQRELINCTIKLHLLADSYSFSYGSVLVPADFSIPAALADSAAAAGLEQGSAPSVWHRMGTWGEGQGLSLDTVPGRLCSHSSGVWGCREGVTSCPLWARDCSQGLWGFCWDRIKVVGGKCGRTGDKIQLKNTSCTNEVCGVFCWFFLFLFFKNTSDVYLLKEPVRLYKGNILH